MSTRNWTSQPHGDRDRELAARIERELPALLALATRLTGDPDDAHGAVQDTLERAWRARTQLRDPAAAGGWLRSILARRVIDRRRGRRDLPAGGATELDDLLLPNIDDPASIVASAQDEGAVRAALRTLATDDRVAVVLHDGENWTAAEVAELLGIGPEAAHKRIQRARAKLVAALAAPQAVSAPTGDCVLVRGQAHDLLDETLDAANRARLQAHLDSCPHCPAALQAAAGVLGSLHSPGHPQPLTESLRERLRALVAEGEATT